MPVRNNRNIYLLTLLGIFSVLWIVLAIKPLYRMDWLLENILVFLGIPLLFLIHKRVPLSNLSYTLIFIFFVCHIYGAHYTYAEAPFGRVIGKWFGLERNHYDRLVHFLWGFLLTLPLFEIMRKKVSRKTGIDFLLACSISFAVGAAYELMEWGVAAIVAPDAGKAFLGAQGDEWDAHKDLSVHLLGALVSAVFLPLRKILT